MTNPAENPAPEAASGSDAARLGMHTAGYCVLCDAIVERAGDGGCAAGHPEQAVSGRIALVEGEPLPSLPRFNLAAFFLPPVWGPFHGLWAGALLLPIWLFADSAVSSAARRGGWAWLPAAVVIAGTLGFQYFFARRANGLAFRRVIDRTSVAGFLARERAWAWACVPAGVALLGWMIWFDITVRAAINR